MSNMPEENRIFRIKKDLSLFKIEKDKWGGTSLLIYFRYEKYWINLPNAQMEGRVWGNIEKGNWQYLFEYEDNDFSARSIEPAMSIFLDRSFGYQYVEYLKELGFSDLEVSATEGLEDLAEEDYYRLKQNVSNGSIFQIEVWRKEDGSFEGLAQEVIE